MMISNQNGPISAELDSMPEQSPRDILQHGADDRRCISGRCKISRRSTGQKQTEVVAVVMTSTLSGQDEYLFSILFELETKHLDMIDLSPSDEFRLSLKGAEVQALSQTPKLCNLALRLVFSNGVHIRWKHKGPNESWKELNTWLLANVETNAETSDSWFFSQDENNSTSDMAQLKRTSNEMDQLESTKENKKKRRLEAKREKRQEASSPSMSNSRTSPTVNSAGHCPLPSERDTSPSSEALVLTSRSGADGYTMLKDLRPGANLTLIGIVVLMSEPRLTQAGDWMRFVNIVDPSNYDAQNPGFKINCFTKRHKEWLPHPEEGDVLILRNVKINTYQGLQGVGYKDKLQWAAFSTSKGEYHHGPPHSAPKQEGLAEGGFGVQFSPFLKPEPAQTTQCIKLSDWWRDLTAQSRPWESNSIARKQQRVHRLISETGPTVPPNGYFDCTVEVLKGYHNSNSQVYTLYVTDYTRNEQMKGVQSNWCPTSLSEFVIQFEMWDAAASIAEKMRPGQFYSIKNARMVVNDNGYPEGKVQQQKIVQLAEDDTTNRHLQALLERKQLWETKQRISESDIRYQLIQDVQPGKFFHCTVELLRIMSKPNQRPCIYVTDYTSHPKLASASLPGLQTLQGRIVKIILSEEQEAFASTASTGSFFCIRKLRLKFSPVEDCVCGILGGNEKLVIKLNPNTTNNENLNGLLRRRESWQRQSGQTPHQEAPCPTLLPLAEITCHDESLLIKDIISTERQPQRHRICARPIDYYPLDLQDAFYQQCSRCNIEIPKKAKACFKCGDFEHEYVQYLFQLYILVKDRDENEIFISIDDKCPVLHGLKRTCIQEDHIGLRKLCERVKPIIGDLTIMHNALKAGKNIELVTSQFYFDIESWLVPGNKKAFRLIDFKALVP